MSLEKPSLADRIEKKRQEVLDLEKTVEDLSKELEEKREARKREQSREQICFFMDHMIVPYLEGIARGFNEPLLTGIRRLIKEGKNPFRPKEGWNRTRETYTALDRFLSTPQTMILKQLARPYVSYRINQVHQEASWIREQILKEEYPDMYDAIMETEGGKEWLDQLIDDFFKTVKRYLRG